jgi:hypothetical protein
VSRRVRQRLTFGLALFSGEMLKGEQLKKAFDNQVNKNVSEDIGECVATLIDWMTEKTNRQAQSLVQVNLRILLS